MEKDLFQEAWPRMLMWYLRTQRQALGTGQMVLVLECFQIQIPRLVPGLDWIQRDYLRLGLAHLQMEYVRQNE